MVPMVEEYRRSAMRNGCVVTCPAWQVVAHVGLAIPLVLCYWYFAKECLKVDFQSTACGTQLGSQRLR